MLHIDIPWALMQIREGFVAFDQGISQALEPKMARSFPPTGVAHLLQSLDHRCPITLAQQPTDIADLPPTGHAHQSLGMGDRRLQLRP